MITATLLGVAAVFFLGYSVQTITGFGCALICLTIGAHLLPIPEILLLMLPLSVVQCGYIAFRHRGAIAWPLVLAWIIPMMGAGAVAGVILAGRLDGDALRQILAVLILILSCLELYALRSPHAVRTPMAPAGTAAGLFGAGVMHGVFAAPGPLLVYTLGRRALDKTSFRSTVILVQLLCNVGLASYWLADGRYRVAHAGEIGLLLPAMIIGVAVGEILHHRVGGHRFKQLIFILLAIGAVTLLLR